MGKRSSMSPGRRLSGGLKVSPMPGEGGSRKKMAAVVAGISRVSDALMGSTKSVRKSWDDSNHTTTSADQKEKGVSKNKVDTQAILRPQVAMTRRLSDASGGQSNDEDMSMNKKTQPNRKNKSCATSEKQDLVSSKITIYDLKWTDGSISLDGLSDNLARLGKEALQRRNIASTAAAEALEEACATESVARSLTMFSDLCSSSKAGNPLPTIDRFLSIYEDVVKQGAVAQSLAASRSSDGPNDAFSMERYKSISRWIEAALATDLEVVSLLDDGAGNSSKCINSEKQTTTFTRNPETVAAASEPPRTSLSKRHNSVGTPAKNQSKVQTNMWTRGCGVSETADLAKTLQHEMKIWFLKFVEQALDAGFELFGECSGGSEVSSRRDNGQVAAVLSHLKRVNDWLDAMGRKPEDSFAESIERLKRRIYGFVIRHVGSAFNSSISLSVA